MSELVQAITGVIDAGMEVWFSSIDLAPSSNGIRVTIVDGDRHGTTVLSAVQADNTVLGHEGLLATQIRLLAEDVRRQ